MTRNCHELLASNPPSLVELIRAASAENIMAHGISVRREVAEGLARTVSHVQQSERATAVTALVEVLASQLAAAVAAAAGNEASVCQQPQFVDAVATVCTQYHELELSYVRLYLISDGCGCHRRLQCWHRLFDFWMEHRLLGSITRLARR